MVTPSLLLLLLLLPLSLCLQCPRCAEFDYTNVTALSYHQKLALPKSVGHFLPCATSRFGECDPGLDHCATVGLNLTFVYEEGLRVEGVLMKLKSCARKNTTCSEIDTWSFKDSSDRMVSVQVNTCELTLCGFRGNDTRQKCFNGARKAGFVVAVVVGVLYFIVL